MNKKHLLLTNDFPPKVGGIQNYLWELWSRLPADSFIVYTTRYKDDEIFDSKQDFKIIRSKRSWLLPTKKLAKEIQTICEQENINHVIYDPVWPLGYISKKVGLTYGVVVHGAELNIPSKFPIARYMIKQTLTESTLTIAAGEYPLEIARELAPNQSELFSIPPGVDISKFNVEDEETKKENRKELSVNKNTFLVFSVSRLVPRKGYSNLIKAVNLIKSEIDIRLVIAGAGRKKQSLQKLIDSLNAPVKLLGRISDEHLAKYLSSADLMAMICRDRWFGLEKEGFGIVFLEAAASGLPQLAGRSGGSHEAVRDGVSGIIVDETNDPRKISEAILKLYEDSSLRSEMALNSREIAKEFNYDLLVKNLERKINSWIYEEKFT